MNETLETLITLTFFTLFLIAIGVALQAIVYSTTLYTIAKTLIVAILIVNIIIGVFNYERPK